MIINSPNTYTITWTVAGRWLEYSIGFAYALCSYISVIMQSQARRGQCACRVCWLRKIASSGYQPLPIPLFPTIFNVLAAYNPGEGITCRGRTNAEGVEHREYNLGSAKNIRCRTSAHLLRTCYTILLSIRTHASRACCYRDIILVVFYIRIPWTTSNYFVFHIILFLALS